MTGTEYLQLTNRVLIANARRILSDVVTGGLPDEMQEDFDAIRKKLALHEIDLFKVELITRDDES